MKIEDESLGLPSTVSLPFQQALLKPDGIRQTACRASEPQTNLSLEDVYRPAHLDLSRDRIEIEREDVSVHTLNRNAPRMRPESQSLS